MKPTYFTCTRRIATALLASAVAMALTAAAAAVERYAIEGTPKTPAVRFDPDGLLRLQGRSIPENSVEFYRALDEWLQGYTAVPARRTRLDVALEVLSADSRAPLLGVLKRLEAIHKGGSQVTVNWHYEEDDEDMLAAGEDYQAVIDLPFPLLAVPASDWEAGGPKLNVAILDPAPGDDRAGDVVAALREEGRQRGITINTSHVEYRVVRCRDRAGFVDEALGLGGFEVAVLVGSDPAVQTLIEAAQLATLAGSRRMVVLVDSGLYSSAALASLSDELTRLGYPAPGNPFIETDLRSPSGPTDPGIAALFDDLQATKPSQGDLDGPFLMAVQDADTRWGSGEAFGRIEKGLVSTGDQVELVGIRQRPLKATVTGVEMFRKLLDRGQAGDNVGLVLRGIDKKDIRRGMVIAKPGTVTAHRRFNARLYLLAREEGGRHTPFQNRFRATAVLRTALVDSGITVWESGAEPAALATATVELIVPVAMDKGLRFAIREGGRTVGAGQVIEIVK